MEECGVDMRRGTDEVGVLSEQIKLLKTVKDLMTLLRSLLYLTA
jgi:hypothetical protein